MSARKFGIRRIIALLLTFVFCILSLIGRIETENFMTIFTVIIGFYFGKSTALDNPSPRKE